MTLSPQMAMTIDTEKLLSLSSGSLWTCFMVEIRPRMLVNTNAVQVYVEKRFDFEPGIHISYKNLY